MAVKLEADQIKKVFDTFDFNSNGILSLAEIDRAVVELYPHFSKNKPVIMRAYKAADISKDGYIDFTEFSRLIDLLYYYDELYKMFRKLDKNNDNRISLSEFKQGHKLIGLEGTTSTDLKKAFDEIDKNRGGYILFDEFCIYAAKKKLSAKSDIILEPQSPASSGRSGTGSLKSVSGSIKSGTGSTRTPTKSKPRPDSIIGSVTGSIGDDATSAVSMTETEKTLQEIMRDDIISKSLYKLSEDLISFLTKSEECDVKIEIGGKDDFKEFYAHSPILRARSSFFYKSLSKKLENKTADDESTTVSYLYSAISTFMSLTDTDNTVVFKKENVSPKIFKIILDYIYGGAAAITKLEELTGHEFLDLLDSSEELGIQGFGEYLHPFFLENYREWIHQNLIFLESFSSKHKEFSNIRSYCLDQLCQDPDVILKSDDLKSINKNVLFSLFARDDLIANEIDLWNLIVNWGIAQDPKLSEKPLSTWSKEDFGILKGIVDGLPSLIRFKWVPSDLFFKQVRPYKQLFDEEVYENTMQFYMVGSDATQTPTLTIQIPASKARSKDANLMINDKKVYANLFSSWIDNKQFKPDYQAYGFKPLYRASTENFSYQTFHEKAGSVANTLTIAKIKGTGELVGGYNPGTWKLAGRNHSSTYPIPSKKAFIFKIDKDNVENSKISRPNDHYNALRHKKESGPNFCDLAIYNQQTPIRCEKQFYNKSLDIVGHDLEDYEVYKILPKY